MKKFYFLFAFIVPNIISAQNVGVGNSNPSYKLHVSGDVFADGGSLRVSDSYPVLFQNYGGGFYMLDATWIRTYGSKSFYHNSGSFRTDGTLQVGSSGSTLNVPNNGNFSYRTNVLFANTSGNVGVGTAAPTNALHIYRDGSTPVLQLYSNRSASSTSPSQLMDASILLGGANNQGWSTPNGAGIDFHTNYPAETSTGRLNFWAYPNTSASPVLTVWNGNVGAGNSSPAYKLDVSGDINLTGKIRLNSTATANKVLKTDGNGNPIWGDDNNTIYTAGSGISISGGAISNTSQSRWTLNGNGIDLYPNSNSWNIGLGTTVPIAKLDIVNSGSGGTGIVGVGEHIRIAALAPNIKFVDVSANVDSFAIHLNQNIFTIGKVNSATSMRNDIVINGSGYVGIGTESPSTKLEVEGGNVLVDGGSLRINDVTAGNGQGFTAFGNSRLYVTAMGSAPATHSVLIGTAYDNDRIVGLEYTPGTTGAATGMLSIGQKIKNNANYTHGITTLYTNGLERMRVASNGNVTIGSTATSFARFSAVRATGSAADFVSSFSDGTQWLAHNPNSGAGSWNPMAQAGDHTIIFSAGSVNTGGLVIGQWSSSSIGIRISTNGNVGIGNGSPSYKLHVSGQIKSDGITESSDARLKKNIQNLENVLLKVSQLHGISFKWKNQRELDAEKISYKIDSDGKTDIGLIAQEVEKIFPELVQTDNEGFKSIEYSKLVAVLVEAIKEQQKQIETFGSYTDKIDFLLKEVSSIKSYLYMESKK